MLNKKLLFRGLLAAGFVGLLSASASADNKTLAAGVCYATSTSGTLGRFGGSITNTATTLSVLSVQCPLVRDNPGGAFVAGSITFDVFDRHSTINIACNVCNEIATSTGISNNCGAPKSSQASGPGVQSLIIPTNPTPQGLNEYSYASCSLPPVDPAIGFSHLARITYDE